LDSVLRIAVVHHPLLEECDGNGARVIRNNDILRGHLCGEGVRIILHGDIHETFYKKIPPPSSRGFEVHVVGTGSVSAKWGLLPTSTPRFYSLIEIPRDGRCPRVHTRCQRKPHGAFEPWNGPSGREGEPFFDIAGIMHQ
jgi:hypothetical protein